VYILYGVEKFLHDDIGDQMLVGTKKDALATFDSQELALEYFERSKLPTFSPLAPLTQPEIQFKEESLLHGFHGAMIEPKNVLPNNPTV
jgi:hypothetical protein